MTAASIVPEIPRQRSKKINAAEAFQDSLRREGFVIGNLCVARVAQKPVVLPVADSVTLDVEPDKRRKEYSRQRIVQLSRRKVIVS